MCRGWSPADPVGGVVGIVVSGVSGARFGGAAEASLVVEFLPPGHVVVAPVERHESADDVGGVFEDGHGLGFADPPVPDPGAEVVFAERGGACGVALGLDGHERLAGGQLVQRRGRHGRVLKCSTPIRA
jgi:hypothetical protein